MHVFIHDRECISKCMWDGHVSYDDKKEIVSNMMQWWVADANHTLRTHRLVSYEDGLVVNEVVHELGASRDDRE